MKRFTILSTLIIVSLLTSTAIISAVSNVGTGTHGTMAQEGLDHGTNDSRTVVIDTDNMTEWYDPEGRVPMTYEEWLETLPEPQPFNMTLVYETPIILSSHTSTKSTSISSNGSSDPPMLVIVNNETYYHIDAGLMGTYIPDLEADGYTVSVYRWTGDLSDPTPLKAWLVTRHGVSPFDGMVLVGDISIAWYENDHDYKDKRAEFPIDLYYMDLDGNWTDADADGMFESHMDDGGDTAPEVWLGRLTASTISGDEATILSNYFARNHLYRIGALSTHRRALAYVDDDWTGWSTGVGNAYSDWDHITDRGTTTADDYRNVRIQAGYELIHVMVHSSPFGHGWKIPNATDPSKSVWDGSFFNTEIPTEDPRAIFYNLFACSNARYVESDYMGGKYIFDTTLGMAAMGSTKTGSMKVFDLFYTPFGAGESIGESFLQWFQGVAPYDAGKIIWFYGMTLLGDPTLTQLNYAHDLAAVSQVSSTTTAVQGDTVTIDVTVQNLGNATENLETTAYYDGNTIDTLSRTLQGGSSTVITFNWNTAGVPGGTYQIMATVDPSDVIPETDETNNDCTSLATVKILVPPVADPDGPYSGPEGLPGMDFDASASYDPDGGTILEYAWDWDNNGVYDEFNPGPFATHAWGDDHVGIVGLRVKDDDDLYGYNATDVTIYNVDPTVNVGPDQTVDEGDVVSFSGSFTDPGWLDIHIISWNFGDGSPPVTGTLTPTHAYGHSGIYTVTLTVTDDDGGVGSDTLVVTVNNVDPIVDAGPDQEALPGHHYTEFCFNGSFTDPSWLDTHTAEWDFGDGSPPEAGLVVESNTPPEAVGTVDEASPRCHKYWVPYQDNYTVTLTVTDDAGGVGKDTLTVTVLRVIGGEEIPLNETLVLITLVGKAISTYWWIPFSIVILAITFMVLKRRRI